MADCDEWQAKWRATCFMHMGHACLELDGAGAEKFKKLYFTEEQRPPVHLWQNNNQFPEDYALSRLLWCLFLWALVLDRGESMLCGERDLNSAPLLRAFGEFPRLQVQSVANHAF